MEGTVAMDTGRVVRLSTIACLVGAALVLIGTAILGRPVAGVCIAAGAIIGAANGHAARRLLDIGIPFVSTSMLRIMTLTVLSFAVGAVFGFGHVWQVILGVGGAQLVMAGSALVELKRR